jgi:hypothetical protein
MKARFATATVALVALLAPASASAQIDHYGITDPFPAATCPDNCQAIGQVTGFQVQNATRRHPLRATGRGKVVAFSITLGQPNEEQATFFNRLFGGDPSVRVSVLRPVSGERNRYVLSGQSPTFALTRYLGSTPTFALPRSLTVKRNYIIALTVPTWAPAFAVGLGNDEAWRSSRDADDCDDVQQRAAQTRRGGMRTYGCFYRTARLLYTAHVVNDPRATSRR